MRSNARTKWTQASESPDPDVEVRRRDVAGGRRRAETNRSLVLDRAGSDEGTTTVEVPTCDVATRRTTGVTADGSH